MWDSAMGRSARMASEPRAVDAAEAGPDDAVDPAAAVDWDAVEDPRLASGVPEATHADELDFIAMTGLTRPGVTDAVAPATPAAADRSPDYPAQPKGTQGDPDEPRVTDAAGLEEVAETADAASLNVWEAAPTEELPPPPRDAVAWGDLDAMLGDADAPPAPVNRLAATEAADVFETSVDEESDAEALARELEALAEEEAPPAPPPPDVDTLASKVRDEILGELREDLAAIRAPHPAPAPEPAPPVEQAVADAAPPSAAPALAEAERLVQELQQQPREVDDSPPEPAAAIALAAAAPPGNSNPRGTDRRQAGDMPLTENERRRGERRSLSRMYAHRGQDVAGYLAAYEGPVAIPETDDPAVEVDFSRDPPKHRHRTTTKQQRVARRVIVGLLAIIVAAVAGYQAYLYAEPYLQTPGTVFREAERLEGMGRAREASNRYRAFLLRYPNDPRAPEALFRAGFVLQVEGDAPVSRQALEDSLSLFDRFIVSYPEHDKVHRARTLRGILLYRLGEHAEAITTLRDPGLHLADSMASLPAWRTIGRAHEALGEVEAARSEFLKAASLSGNYSADEDYETLARMYRRLAERTEPGPERDAHLTDSMHFFRQAQLVPGISRDRSQAFEREIDFMRRELTAESAPPVVSPVLDGPVAPSAYQQFLGAGPEADLPALDPDDPGFETLDDSVYPGPADADEKEGDQAVDVTESGATEVVESTPELEEPATEAAHDDGDTPLTEAQSAKMDEGVPAAGVTDAALEAAEAAIRAVESEMRATGDYAWPDEAPSLEPPADGRE